MKPHSLLPEVEFHALEEASRRYVAVAVAFMLVAVILGLLGACCAWLWVGSLLGFAGFSLCCWRVCAIWKRLDELDDFIP
jgi:hypothetical protein